MHLFYIDESFDQNLFILTALMVEDKKWRDFFLKIKDFRRQLRKKDGIYMNAELHATEFVSGKGRSFSSKIVPKGRRCAIFDDTLRFLGQVNYISIFNVALKSKREDWAFERLVNRINRTMENLNSYAILFCDEGKEYLQTKLSRKMHVYNPIPSSSGFWSDSGMLTKNITIDRIIEDPVFKDSKQSYFIQLADFCAYALLRREVPLPSKSKYGLNISFSHLNSILFKSASTKDPEGIVRD